MATLRIDKVNKSYGEAVILSDIDLSINEGEFVVLVGPSGCGKSTLLRMIAGLDGLTSGDIFIGERRVNNLEPSQRKIAMVFQSYALYPHMNVKKNMTFGLKFAGMAQPEMDRRVAEAARMLRLEPLLERRPRDLSGGQRQRVAIGRAIVREPDVFLFDEPLSNLDAALRVSTRVEISKLHRQLGATMVYVTHDQIEAMTLADRIVVMRAGEIEQVGSPMNIYSNPMSSFVADFFGSPSMNLIVGEVVHGGETARFRSGYLHIVLPERFKAVKPGKTTLGIRPEHVGVALDGKGDVELPVRLVEPLGKDTLLYFDDGTERAFIAVDQGLAMAEVRTGERVVLSFDPRRLYLFGADGRRIEPR
jgi:ABC-type sugar transport system ATPase subunit